MNIKESWEAFADKMIQFKQGSPRIIELVKSYKKYVQLLSPEARAMWMATPTYMPGRMRMTVIPRMMMPFYIERYSEVRDRYVSMAEAYFHPPKLLSTPASPLNPLLKEKVLVCEPNFEPATNVGSQFIRKYISTPYRAKGVDIDALWRLRDIRVTFASRTRISNVVCGIGHGSDDIFTGQLLRPLWTVNEYGEAEVQGKTIKLLSCLCGRLLGPDLIRTGAKMFQGYTQEYIFYMNNRFLLAPYMDPTAELFIKTYCDAVGVLLDGGTNADAYLMERNLLTANAEKMADSDPEVSAALYHNAKHLVMLGNDDAVINVG